MKVLKQALMRRRCLSKLTLIKQLNDRIFWDRIPTSNLDHRPKVLRLQFWYPQEQCCWLNINPSPRNVPHYRWRHIRSTRAFCFQTDAGSSNKILERLSSSFIISKMYWRTPVMALLSSETKLNDRRRSPRKRLRRRDTNSGDSKPYQSKHDSAVPIRSQPTPSKLVQRS